MFNGSLWEAAVWFCFWTAQEERACPGEPRTSRVVHRVTGYPWQWGPEYRCQDNLALAGLCTYTGERQRQGDWQKVYVTHPHSPSSLVTGGRATPEACYLVPDLFFPFVLAASKHPQKRCGLKLCGCNLAASPVNRIPKSFLLPSPGELLHLPPLPCVSYCLALSQLTNEP